MADELRNMTPFDEIACEIDDLYEQAGGVTEITTEAQHDAASELLKEIHNAGKRADALRVEEKRPLDEQVKAIQDRYNPYIQPKKGKVDRAKSVLGDLLAEWRRKIAAEKEAAAAVARREAEEKARAAEAAMRASRGDLEAREEAEAQLADAKAAEKQAKRADKAATTGTGLRSYWHPELTDIDAAVRHYWSCNRVAFEALVIDLAREDVRAGKRDIPGFCVVEDRRAVS